MSTNPVKNHFCNPMISNLLPVKLFILILIFLNHNFVTFKHTYLRSICRVKVSGLHTPRTLTIPSVVFPMLWTHFILYLFEILGVEHFVYGTNDHNSLFEFLLIFGRKSSLINIKVCHAKNLHAALANWDELRHGDTNPSKGGGC